MRAKLVFGDFEGFFEGGPDFFEPRAKNLSKSPSMCFAHIKKQTSQAHRSRSAVSGWRLLVGGGGWGWTQGRRGDGGGGRGRVPDPYPDPHGSALI
jgi:hypothetical protein